MALKTARDLLWEREGKPPPVSIREMALAGYDHVLYCQLDANIPDVDLTPEHLADLAIASVGEAGDRNGIRYLAQTISVGIRTPLTEPYRAAILKKTGAATVEEPAALGRSR